MNRSFYAVFSMPLWFLIAVWILLSRKNVIDDADIAMRIMLMDDIYKALPVPQSKFEQLLIEKIIEWINREKEAARILNSIGISAIGYCRR